jgi:hypothetical protein
MPHASLILLKYAFISPLPGADHSPGSTLPPASSLNLAAALQGLTVQSRLTPSLIFPLSTTHWFYPDCIPTVLSLFCAHS